MPIVLIPHGDQVALVLYLALEPTLQVQLSLHFFDEEVKRQVRRQHQEPRIVSVVDFYPYIL